MRKFVTAVAAALTLGFAAPAIADQNDGYNNQPYQGQYNQNQGQYNQHQGQPDNDYRYPRDGRADRRHYDNYDFDRHNGQFRSWERGWNDYGNHQYRNQRPLNFRQLAPRLAAQGYYGVRKVSKDRWGAYRAYAFNQRGRPVLLRINPYTGRVMDVRYV